MIEPCGSMMLAWTVLPRHFKATLVPNMRASQSRMYSSSWMTTWLSSGGTAAKSTTHS